jgi:hypothetical protein
LKVDALNIAKARIAVAWEVTARGVVCKHDQLEHGDRLVGFDPRKRAVNRRLGIAGRSHAGRRPGPPNGWGLGRVV